MRLIQIYLAIMRLRLALGAAGEHVPRVAGRPASRPLKNARGRVITGPFILNERGIRCVASVLRGMVCSDL